MLKLNLTILNVCLIAFCWSQTHLTSTQFLQQELQSVITPDQKPTFKAPFLDEIEVRTETDEFDLNRQEITLRVSPLGPKVRKSHKNLTTMLFCKKVDLFTKNGKSNN